MDRLTPGGMTYTWLHCTGTLRVTASTGMEVVDCRMRSSMLSWWGDRCSTTTNAMPGSAGMCLKKVFSASMPPADAPMPTTGNGRSLRSRLFWLTGLDGVSGMEEAAVRRCGGFRDDSVRAMWPLPGSGQAAAAHDGLEQLRHAEQRGDAAGPQDDQPSEPPDPERGVAFHISGIPRHAAPCRGTPSRPSRCRSAPAG